MGDSSGLLEISSNGENKVSSVSAALGGSVSFGRFLSESLDWGKWSSFCQKRHLEEIEMFSTPGSVAQKKAYFEAHYKKAAAAAAARKSASLLEQANVVAASNAERNDETSKSRCNLKLVLEEGGPKSAKETNSGQEKCEPSLRIESSEIIDDIENQNRVSDMEEHWDNSLVKQPLTESSIVNQETRDSIEKKKRVSVPKATCIHRPPRVHASPAPKLCSPAKYVSSSFNSTPTSNKYGTESSQKKKPTLGAIHMSTNSSQGRNGAITPAMNRTSPILKKVEESKVSSGRGPKTTKTPKPELRRGRAVSDQSFSGRVKVDVKLHRDSVEYNSNKKHGDDNSIRGNQLQAQTASPSLSLRTVERVEKRKEIPHNLEVKFRGREAKKLQFREVPKEKAESEIKKLRQSLNFKARPLPAFYHSPESSMTEKGKVQPTRPQSPKLGRTNCPRANSSAISLSPMQSSIKGDRTTHARGKSSQALRSKYDTEKARFT